MGQAIFLEQRLYIENLTTIFEQTLKEIPFHTLYEKGFSSDTINSDVSIAYLVSITQEFVYALKNDGEFEVIRTFHVPSDTIYQHLGNEAPFTIGYEFISV